MREIERSESEDPGQGRRDGRNMIGRKAKKSERGKCGKFFRYSNEFVVVKVKRLQAGSQNFEQVWVKRPKSIVREIEMFDERKSGEQCLAQSGRDRIELTMCKRDAIVQIERRLKDRLIRVQYEVESFGKLGVENDPRQRKVGRENSVSKATKTRLRHVRHFKSNKFDVRVGQQHRGKNVQHFRTQCRILSQIQSVHETVATRRIGKLHAQLSELGFFQPLAIQTDACIICKRAHVQIVGHCHFRRLFSASCDRFHSFFKSHLCQGHRSFELCHGSG